MKTPEGTVTISIEKFDNLRNFVKELEEGNAIMYYHNFQSSYSSEYETTIFYSKDQALKEIARENGKFVKELKELKEQPRKEIEDLKKMSIWQFMKWKSK